MTTFGPLSPEHKATVKKRMSIDVQKAIADSIPVSNRPENYLINIDQEVEYIYNNTMRGLLEYYTTQIASLTNKVSELETTVASHVSTIQNHESRISTLESKVN